MNFSIRLFSNLLKKELQLYFFGTSFFMVSSVLSIGLFLLFRFTYPPEKMSVDVAVSTLWSVHMISSLFSLIASQEWDFESAALRAIKLSGAEGYIVFLTKSLASFFSISILWILELFIWFILIGSNSIIPSPEATTDNYVRMFIQLGVTGLMATGGISFLGQITSVLALHSRFRHVLMFIIFFPVSIPTLVAASSFSRLSMGFNPWQAGSAYLMLEASFCLFFFALGVILYDFLWEE
jgi:heme exporter protein B